MKCGTLSFGIETASLGADSCKAIIQLNLRITALFKYYLSSIKVL